MTDTIMKWPQLFESDLDRNTATIDETTFRTTERIVDEVLSGGEAALRKLAIKFGDRSAEEPLVIGRQQLHEQLELRFHTCRGLL